MIMRKQKPATAIISVIVARYVTFVALMEDIAVHVDLSVENRPFSAFLPR